MRNLKKVKPTCLSTISLMIEDPETLLKISIKLSFSWGNNGIWFDLETSS